MAAPRRAAVTALVREKIADGTLKPGGAVPSAAALARETGIHFSTCRKALRELLAEGTLTRGISPTARLRVAQPGGETLREALSRTLAARRHAAKLMQPDLADLIGVSVTTVCHAETGRVWQSRYFWVCADRLLGGGLLDLYDTYQGDAPAAEPEPAVRAPPVLPLSITITPDGVTVTWPDGTETVARPPGLT